MKYLLMLVLGFCLHKGLEEVYDYYYEGAFIGATCSDTYKAALNDPNEPAPLSKRFQCTYREMGPARYLSYVLMRPHWVINDGQTWYY